MPKERMTYEDLSPAEKEAIWDMLFPNMTAEEIEDHLDRD
jgi:hypothetical protein